MAYDKEILTAFIEESLEHIQILNDKMLKLENAFKNDEELSEDELNAMFRSAHTIKGTASFLGISKIINLSHKAENLLQKLRDNEMSLNIVIIEALFAALDKLSELLESLAKTDTDDSVETKDQIEKIEIILNAEKNDPLSEKQISTQSDGSITKKYIDQFLVETNQNLDDLNELLLITEKGDGNNHELINSIFRIIHTIKGSSGLINASKILEISHNTEDILSVFREQNKPFDTETISLLFESIDVIAGLCKSLKETGSNEKDDISKISKELSEYYYSIKSNITTKSQDTKKTKQLLGINPLSDKERVSFEISIAKGYKTFLLFLEIEEKIPEKSIKIALTEERLKKQGVVTCIRPDIELADSAQGKYDFKILFCSNLTENEIKKLLSLDGLNIISVKQYNPDDIREESTEKAKETSTSKSSTPDSSSNKKSNNAEISTIRIDSQKLDKLMTLSGELVIAKAKFSRINQLFNQNISQYKDSANVHQQMLTDIDQFQNELKNLMIKINENSSDNNIKSIDIFSKLNEYVSLLSKSNINKNIYDNINILTEATGSLEKISTNIQDSVMQTRLIPVEGIFTRFKRVVRDVSKEINKDVHLLIEGAETELDKKLVDSLNDPLTHLIRNAIGHGIEDAEERYKADKPAQGTVLLKASNKGNSIWIEVADDGKGIDTNKIITSAIKKELITENQAEQMSHNEILNIIFMPGFSMAAEVTDLSGRGVGMDVVKDTLFSHHGTIDINSEIGKGTSFILKIPLTLAIINALLISRNDSLYALPIDSVVEIITINKDDIYTVDGTKCVKLRDHALSIINLQDILQVNNEKKSEASDINSVKIVIISNQETQLGIPVDSVISKEELVIKPFSKHFDHVKGLTGISILADGNIALILDPATIIMNSK